MDGGDRQRWQQQSRAGHQQPRTSGLTNELTHRPPPEAHQNGLTFIATVFPTRARP